MFLTLEDETGVANLIVWPKVFERFRPVVIGTRLVRVRGPLQSQDGVIHVVAEIFDDRSPLLRTLGEAPQALPAPARADEGRRPQQDMHEKGARRVARHNPGAAHPRDQQKGLFDDPADGFIPNARSFR
jgi:error-prone DNA polymerase